MKVITKLLSMKENQTGQNTEWAVPGNKLTRAWSSDVLGWGVLWCTVGRNNISLKGVR